jgi:hypothetical protein
LGAESCPLRLKPRAVVSQGTIGSLETGRSRGAFMQLLAQRCSEFIQLSLAPGKRLVRLGLRARAALPGTETASEAKGELHQVVA